mmetsp:Transcript_16119/g.27298  ORF Transcript_16119/g.27298 Transcript_16119/m.27298 type:complete len:155 (+) Transcript_16119:135-599(+)
MIPLKHAIFRGLTLGATAIIVLIYTAMVVVYGFLSRAVEQAQSNHPGTSRIYQRIDHNRLHSTTWQAFSTASQQSRQVWSPRLLLKREEAYDADEKSVMDHDCCPICLSKFVGNDSVSGCRRCWRAFHHDCISEWLSRSSSCPLCRSTFQSLQN